MMVGKRDYYFAQEVCQMFGLSKKTLFSWEEKRLISKIPKDWRGWRMYSQRHIRQVKQVMERKEANVRR